MSTQHTSGPWTWEEGTPIVSRRWNGKDCAIAVVDSRTLAWHENGNCSSREAGANARLIAAAPELLEALQNLLTFPLGTFQVAAAKAAIAKAQGLPA